MIFVGDQNKCRIKIYREFYHCIVDIVNEESHVRISVNCHASSCKSEETFPHTATYFNNIRRILCDYRFEVAVFNGKLNSV
jgi:hypothetical protein